VQVILHVVLLPDQGITTETGWCTRIGNGQPNTVTGGWFLNGYVGFVWNAEPGGGFPYSYINGAVFNDRPNGMVYDHRFAAWSLGYATALGYVAPIQGQGRVAMVEFWGNSAIHPSVVVGTFENSDRSWAFGYEVSHGSRDTSYVGDYIRIRPYIGPDTTPNYGPLWVGSGFNIDSSNQIQPFYYIFGIAGTAGSQCLAPLC
jgi:hypothetical protein